MRVAPGPQLFDDPIARTRMAWVRTVLAVIVLGFLLVRGVIVLEVPVAWAVLSAAVTGGVVTAALTRFAALGRQLPLRMSPALRAIVVGGVLTLVGIGLVVTLAAG